LKELKRLRETSHLRSALHLPMPNCGRLIE